MDSRSRRTTVADLLANDENPIANRQEIPETPKPIVEKSKQEKATRVRISKKKKPRLLARGAEHKLLRRATASLTELKWKLSQSNFPPALSNMQGHHIGLAAQ